MDLLPDGVAHAYLDRLGVDVRRGEVDEHALRALQRAHLGRVPYETLDIVRGAPPPIDPLACVHRVLAGRGGYCFHLNGAFSMLLDWLGVDVTRHVAGVQGRSAAAPPGANGNHLALTVRLGEDVFLVDVGLGDGPAEPLPLQAGVHRVDGFSYALRRSEHAAGGWRFDHDPRNSFRGFDMAPGPASTGDFAAMHVQLSTESGFARVVTVQRRRAGGLEILRGCVLEELDSSGVRSTELTGPADWWDLVLGWFGLAYGDLGKPEREALWVEVRRTHDEWDAAGRP